MAADPIIYCLHNLTDYDQFERLCHDLMATEGYPDIEPLGGMKDKGRDAIHIDRKNKQVTVFAYSVRENWQKKLEEDCAKIHEHGHACQRLVFLCTSTFTPTERDKAVALVHEKFGWHLELYGLERLRIRLTANHSKLVASHPQIFPLSLFEQGGTRPKLPLGKSEFSVDVKGTWWSLHGGKFPMYLRLELTHAGDGRDALKSAIVEIGGQAYPTVDRAKLGPLDEVDFKDMILKFLPTAVSGQAKAKLLLTTVRGRIAEAPFEASTSGWRPPELWESFTPY